MVVDSLDVRVATRRFSTTQHDEKEGNFVEELYGEFLWGQGIRFVGGDNLS